MANTVRIKRRITGNSGAPSTLKNAELAYNEVDNTLYYGKGDLGDGSASSIIAIAGSGVYATISYVDGAIAAADLAAYAKKAADNTFAATYTNTFNGTVNVAGTFQIGGVQVTSTAAELNILDGVTATAAELNTLDGITASTAELNTLDGITASTAELNTLDGITASTAELNILDGVTADSTEINYLDGVIAGTGVASKAVVLDANKDVNIGTGSITCAALTTTGNAHIGGDLTVDGVVTTINSTTVTVDDKNLELGSTASPSDATADNGGITLKGTTDKTLSWVLATGAWTSNQNFNLTSGNAYHINGTSVLSSTALGSGVTSSSLTSVGTISSGTWQGTAVGVSYGGTGATNAGDARTNLGLVIGTDVQAYNSTLAAVAAGTYTGDDSIVTVGTISSGTWQGTAVGVSYGGTGATNAGDARTNLGLVIGTDVQAYDAELAAIAGLSSEADKLPYFTGSGTAALATFTSFGRAIVDDSDAATARTTLGLGSIATQSASNVSITGGTIDNVVIDGGSF